MLPMPGERRANGLDPPTLSPGVGGLEPSRSERRGDIALDLVRLGPVAGSVRIEPV